ncbi:hypothetical protein BJX63DRAFT_400099 [Aspergillus granulosus]|uniref:Uncharacterized protein n=1 Tax=Aspergillus granulosus TaxID=176169 RepID=A0ABR4H6P9_9EURO
MARPATQTRIAHLLKHWPADPIRPASVSVQTFLQSHLTPPAQQPSQTSTTPTTTGKISDSSLNALSSLLEDRYARRYPLPPKLRRPASNPDHYDNLIREFEEAPSRDWLGRLWKRLSGQFRLQ